MVKDQRFRITIGVGYRAWTADKTINFSGAALSKLEAQWPPGCAPAVHDGSAWIESYGTPAFQAFRTRDDFVPEDPLIPFRIRWRGKFHQADPVYTNGLTFFAIDGQFGAASDMRLLQVGAVDCEGFAGDEGNILPMPPGQILTPDAASAIAWSAAEHSVEVEWNPGQTPQYRMLVDSVEVFTSQDAPRPVGAAVGYPTFTEAIIPDPDDPSIDTEPPEAYLAPGLADAPVDLIETIELTCEELGVGGHETIIYPGWTTPNAGGDIDTAVEGERFEKSGRTCAKIFMSNVLSARVSKSASSEFDSFTVTLALPKASDPATYINLYAGTRWDCEPPILIDSRVGDGAGNWTAWRRQIAGRIWKAHIEYGLRGVPHLVLSGPCIAMAALYSEASMAFIKATETLPGIYQNMSFTEVFQTMVDAAADLDGDEWAATHDILAPDIVPDAIGTGGQTLLSCMNSWLDRLGQARYMRYATSGVAEFGQVATHLKTIGGGPPDYEFRGLGGTADYPVMGASRDDDRRQAPGQVQYHPNTPLFAWLDIATYGQPGVLAYPAWPYPANQAGWSDSIPYTNVGMGSLITGWPNKYDVNQFGGPAPHRLRSEVVRGQAYTFEVIGRDHIEPDDEVYFDDPDGTGYVGNILVDRVDIEYAGLKITTRVTGYATDPTGLMLRRK